MNPFAPAPLPPPAARLFGVRGPVGLFLYVLWLVGWHAFRLSASGGKSSPLEKDRVRVLKHDGIDYVKRNAAQGSNRVRSKEPRRVHPSNLLVV